MADLKISALTASTTPLAGTEVLPIVQSSTTKQVSVANLTAGRAMSALSGSFGTGTSAYSIGGTQVSATNTSANTYLSVYAGTGASTQGGFLIGANNTENQANILWVESGNYLQVSANPVSSKIKILTAGVDIGDFTTNGFSPTNGRGIDFSATAGTGTSELLADYEEGTWTCSFSGQTATATGYYTKVGRTVTVWCQYTGDTNAAASGALLMSGLPFTASANSKHYSPLLIQNGNSAGGNNVETFATGVVPMMRPDGYVGSTSTGTNSYYQESLIQNGTVVYINFSYFV